MTESQSAVDANDDTQTDDPNLGGTFEDDCIDLLCKQENTLALLSEAHVLDSLDLAKKMVEQFLDFAEAHFEDEQLQDVGRRLCEVYEQTKDHEKRLWGQTFKRLRRMVGMDVMSEEQAQDAHQQLRAKYIKLYSEFFAICVNRFPEASPTRNQFVQSVDTFVKEIELKW